MEAKSTDDRDGESALRIVKSFAAQLAEHFDSVQITCTRHDPSSADGTLVVNHGEGNWFSRYGAVKEWINKQEHRSRREVDAEDDGNE